MQLCQKVGGSSAVLAGSRHFRRMMRMDYVAAITSGLVVGFAAFIYVFTFIDDPDRESRKKALVKIILLYAGVNAPAACAYKYFYPGPGDFYILGASVPPLAALFCVLSATGFITAWDTAKPEFLKRQGKLIGREGPVDMTDLLQDPPTSTERERETTQRERSESRTSGTR